MRTTQVGTHYIDLRNKDDLNHYQTRIDIDNEDDMKLLEQFIEWNESDEIDPMMFDTEWEHFITHRISMMEENKHNDKLIFIRGLIEKDHRKHSEILSRHTESFESGSTISGDVQFESLDKLKEQITENKMIVLYTDYLLYRINKKMGDL